MHAAETGPATRLYAAETGPATRLYAAETGPATRLYAAETGPATRLYAAETGPATRYSLWRNTTRIMKIEFDFLNIALKITRLLEASLNLLQQKYSLNRIFLMICI